MALESTTYIDGLVSSNPVADDVVAQGDDHLRLIKAALKASFPNTTRPRFIEEERADLASASSPDLFAVTSNYVRITGTTTITDFADASEPGQTKIVVFAAALTLTHDDAKIVLPTGANIATTAGDVAVFIADTTSLFRCLSYQRANGKALVETAVSADSISALKYGRQTIPVAAAGMTTPNATYVISSNVSCIDFDEGESAFFVLPLPKSWDEGTITFKAFSSVASGGGSGASVIWSLRGIAISHDDNWSSAAPSGSSSSSANTTGTDGDLLTGAESSAITVAGSPVAGDLIKWEIYRDDGSLASGTQVTLICIEIYVNITAGNDA
jgi:hypothetical protein